MDLNNSEIKSVSFRVQGEFITTLAREKCYYEGNFQYAMKLLKSCMDSNEVPENEVTNMAIAILDGRAELQGTYPSDDYGFVYLDQKDDRWDLGKLIDKSFTDMKKLQEDYNDLQQKYIFIIDQMEDYEKQSLNRDYKAEYGEYLFKGMPNYIAAAVAAVPVTANPSLDSYIKRQLMDTEDDYGWLEPNGTFYPVDWGRHEGWADAWQRKNMSDEDYMNLPHTQMSGDYLSDRGWVLLHNPSLGIAFVTQSEIRQLTEEQKNFLYNYYLERNCEEEANKIYDN